MAIEILRFERRSSPSVDDANWLVGRVVVTLKHFACDIDLSLTTHDLTQLESEFDSCLKTLNGTSKLRPFEPVFQLDLVFDKRGLVTVTGSVQTLGPHKTALAFSFESDQSYLTETKRQLKAAVQNFPIRTNVE